MAKDLKILIPQFVSESIIINGISTDSRKVVQGEIFVAIHGFQSDGHNYIDQAIQNGASVILISREFKIQQELKVKIIRVKDTSQVYAELCAAWFDFPSHDIQLIGVTGTNGKTTVTTLLFQALTKLGYKCGLISTVEYRIGSQVFPSTHTTPDAYRFNELLAEMLGHGCEYVFAEVSSHAIAQNRISSLNFRVGVFTNLTHDHLDYHGTFKEYRDAKKKFFDLLPKDAFAIINQDDKNANFMVQNCRAQVHKYSLQAKSRYSARILEQSLHGQLLRIDQHEVHVKLIGRFNVYNILSCIGVLDVLGFDEAQYLPVMTMLEGANGRFQTVFSKTKGIIGIIDYAHTPDALENVLKTIREIQGGGRIITVFGCGGDRDRSKRPEMAKVASSLSDIIIITSDNPRTEDPQVIIDEIQNGISPDKQRSTFENIDRLQAIKMSCQFAESGDIILIAGKGHEDYQIIGTERIDFDDIKVFSSIISEA